MFPSLDSLCDHIYSIDNVFLLFREQPVQQHLKQVYTCLMLSTLAAAAGAYIHLFTPFFSGSILTSFAAIGCMLTLFATPDENGKNVKTRIGLLLGFAFFTGILYITIT